MRMDRLRRLRVPAALLAPKQLPLELTLGGLETPSAASAVWRPAHL
jgi:hypothetical protein